MHAHADRRCLLSGIEVDKAGDAALREFLLHTLLEAADRDHIAIGADQLLAVQLHGGSPLPVIAGRISVGRSRGLRRLLDGPARPRRRIRSTSRDRTVYRSAYPVHALSGS